MRHSTARAMGMPFYGVDRAKPSLVKEGPSNESQVKFGKSATTLTVFFYVRYIESAIQHTFSVRHISLFFLR